MPAAPVRLSGPPEPARAAIEALRLRLGLPDAFPAVVLAEAEAADAIAMEMKATPSGIIRVNAPVTFGASMLAPFITQYLDQYPGTIAHQGIGTDSTAMIEIFQDQQSLLDDRMALLAFDVGYKTDATGVVLIGRVV